MARENIAASPYKMLMRFIASMENVPGAIRFTIPGEIRGKQRARSRVLTDRDGEVVKGKGGRAIIKHHTPSQTVNYEQNVALWYRSVRTGPPTTGPVILLLEITHMVNPEWPKWKKTMIAMMKMLPVIKPDGDNIEKIVKDALNKIAWVDDVQVVATAKSKRFGDQPGVDVTIIPLAELPSTIKVIPR